MRTARAPRRDPSWQLQDAKARLSEVVDQANTHGPQVITRRGKKTAVVLAFDDYVRLSSGALPLVDMLLRSPLRGSGLRVDRPRDTGRGVDLPR